MKYNKKESGNGKGSHEPRKFGHEGGHRQKNDMAMLKK